MTSRKGTKLQGNRNNVPPSDPGRIWRKRLRTLDNTGSSNKYHAHRITVDGYRFDSKREAKRYEELKILEQAGRIRSLDVHPSWMFKLEDRWLKYPDTTLVDGSRRKGRRVKYTADFIYHDLDRGRRVVEDVKGFDTADSKLRRALLLFFHGHEVEIIK